MSKLSDLPPEVFKNIWFVGSGGGSKGPYTVGVLKYVYTVLGLDIAGFGGTSIGGTIALHQVQYKNKDKLQGYQDLEDLFLGLKTSDVWKHWFLFRELAGLWKRGLVNSSPYTQLIKGILDVQKVMDSDRDVRITAVNLTTKKVEVFDKTFVPLWQPAAATAAIPMFFGPVRMRNHWWVDGGVRVVTPLKAAIKAGASMVIASVLTPKGHIGEFDPDSNALEIGMRSIDAMFDAVVEKDVAQAQQYNIAITLKELLVEKGLSEKVIQKRLEDRGLPYNLEGKRYIPIFMVRPDSPLLPDSREFKPEQAREIHIRGFGDAGETFEFAS